MKFANNRPYADPEKAARKILEIAQSVEPARRGATGRSNADAVACVQAHSSSAELLAKCEPAAARLRTGGSG